jgi:signal transduction histidine kinase/CheY-like chemotaxis protein
MYSAFGYFDFVIAREHIGYFFVIRYLIVLPILSGVLLFSFNKAFRKYWQVLLAFSYIVAGTGIIHMLTEIPENMFYYGGLFLVFMAGYFFIKLRYLYASISGIIILLIYNAGIIFLGNETANISYLLIGNGFYLSANLIGIIAAYNIELLERKDFIQNKELSEREAKIKKANRHLEQTVSERTESLKSRNHQLEKEIQNRKALESYLIKTKEKAEESSRLKTAFLNNISHEFHTPMNGIIGFSALIAESCHCTGNAEKYAQYLKQSCDRLLEIVSDTVEISKIRSGSIRLVKRYEDFTPVINELIHYSREKAQRKGLEFNYFPKCEEDEMFFMFDKKKIKRMLRHIIDNALKFTSEGYISVACKKTEDQQITITVTDSGIGISKNMQEQIFEPFKQTENLISKNLGGNGVGLSLAKSYAELSGGSIDLKSSPGLGTQISIRLPVHEEANSQNIKIEGKAVHVIIAETDISRINYLNTVLESIGIETCSVAEGEKAINICRNQKNVHLLLINPELNGLNGYETSKLIKQFRPEIPIVAMLKSSGADVKEKVFTHFFDDYITLPLTEDRIYLLAEKYL